MNHDLYDKNISSGAGGAGGGGSLNFGGKDGKSRGTQRVKMTVKEARRKLLQVELDSRMPSSPKPPINFR